MDNTEEELRVLREIIDQLIDQIKDGVEELDIATVETMAGKADLIRSRVRATNINYGGSA